MLELMFMDAYRKLNHSIRTHECHVVYGAIVFPLNVGMVPRYLL